MSRFLLLTLFCTSAVACTSATSQQTTLAHTPVEVVQPRPIDAKVNVRDQLAAARAANLARLEAYAQREAFPKNKVSHGLLNVFRDDEGHLCAVANLINLDGHTNLIDATASNDNFIILADVESGPLLGWILESGFTQEEIGMIQVPYMGEVDHGVPVQEPVLATVREAETARIKAALLQVHRSISANTIASLDLAVERATSGMVIAQVGPQHFSQPPR